MLNPYTILGQYHEEKQSPRKFKWQTSQNKLRKTFYQIIDESHSRCCIGTCFLKKLFKIGLNFMKSEEIPASKSLSIKSHDKKYRGRGEPGHICKTWLTGMK